MTGKFFRLWLNLKLENIDDIIDNDLIDKFFETLIIELYKDLDNNIESLKEVFKRLVLIKRFNVNKKLQLKCLEGAMS